MKYKGIEVKRKPWYMRLIYLRRAKGAAQLGKILLKDKYLKEFEENRASFATKTILEHEYAHVMSFRKQGMLKSELIYWFAPKFRFKEELYAIEKEMKVFKKYKRKYKINKTAKWLSGFGYLWCASYENAKRELERVWREV